MILIHCLILRILPYLNSEYNITCYIFMLELLDYLHMLTLLYCVFILYLCIHFMYCQVADCHGYSSRVQYYTLPYLNIAIKDIVQ